MPASEKYRSTIKIINETSEMTNKKSFYMKEVKLWLTNPDIETLML